MPHKFNGLWRLLLLPDGAKPRSDGQIFLRLNDAGDIQGGSNHDGKPLTGKAEETAGDHRLTLQQKEEGNVRDLSGLLVSDEDTTGQKSLAIVGRYKDTETAIDGKRDALPPPAQDEGTWVITKP